MRSLHGAVRFASKHGRPLKGGECARYGAHVRIGLFFNPDFLCKFPFVGGGRKLWHLGRGRLCVSGERLVRGQRRQRRSPLRHVIPERQGRNVWSGVCWEKRGGGGGGDAV